MVNRPTWAGLALALLFAQRSEATIIVVGQLGDRIVFAADSFFLMPGEEAGPTSCKIQEIGKRSLFANSGLSGATAKTTDPTAPAWSAESFAAEAFRNRKAGSPLKAVAESWSGLVITALRLDLLVRREIVMRGIDADGSILSGLFAEGKLIL